MMAVYAKVVSSFGAERTEVYSQIRGAVEEPSFEIATLKTRTMRSSRGRKPLKAKGLESLLLASV